MRHLARRNLVPHMAARGDVAPTVISFFVKVPVSPITDHLFHSFEYLGRDATTAAIPCAQ
jgi:hypothetical protein